MKLIVIEMVDMRIDGWYALVIRGQGLPTIINLLVMNESGCHVAPSKKWWNCHATINHLCLQKMVLNCLIHHKNQPLGSHQVKRCRSTQTPNKSYRYLQNGSAVTTASSQCPYWTIADQSKSQAAAEILPKVSPPLCGCTRSSTWRDVMLHTVECVHSWELLWYSSLTL